MVDTAAPAPDIRERIAAIQQKSAWGTTVVWAAVAIIVVVGVLKYGLPAVEGVSGEELLFGVFVLVMAYLIFIRKQKYDVDADALVEVLTQAWRGGRLGCAICHQLEFDLTTVLIEVMGDGYYLVSCHNEAGGVKTVGIHGMDHKSLRLVEIYDGNASEVRVMLEKSKAVMQGLERGYEMKKAELDAERLGL